MLGLLKDYIEQEELYRYGDRVLLAVSGGVDSVVMAHLFSEADIQCAIAHCNFQLRGGESDTDEEFVRTLAGSLEMTVHVKRFDVDYEMKEKGISLQMAARDLRYAWFDELTDQYGYNAIATAHNMNDSVETFFLNLTRGTGIRGLTGIPARNGKVIRPLLFASRRDIEEYARNNSVAFRIDSSNLETKYQRNKVRHDVIPSLELINPGFLETMSANMGRLNETARIMERAIERTRDELFLQDQGVNRIPIDRLKVLSPLHTWFYELFAPYGFSQAQCEGIVQILHAKPGKRSISPSHQLYKDREHLILVATEKEAFDRYYLDSPEKPSSLPFPMDVEVIDREELGEIPRERHIACLDYDRITFPLTIRHWLHGDYFFPLGMEQDKKLSDFFVDEKVPVPVKERTWILASGRKIVWIMGHRIDNRFRITDQTTKVLLLSLQPDIVA